MQRRTLSADKFSAIITSDIHLTDKPNDEYRFGLFPWLAEMAAVHQVKNIFLLGDLLDAKDRHPASLVNRTIDQLTDLARVVDQVIILKGNHDYIDESTPFFRFLSKVPKLEFIVRPTRRNVYGKLIAFLPNDKNPFVDWQGFPLDSFDYIFLHQTFAGCQLENGTSMKEGLDVHFFDNLPARVYSGDIHVPQVIGKVKYIGSPYHITYGSRFEPRVLMIKDGKETDLHFPAPRKRVLDIDDVSQLDSFNVVPGDRTKVRVSVYRDQLTEWDRIKKEIESSLAAKGVEIFGIEPVLVSQTVTEEATLRVDPTEIMDDATVFDRFCEREKIDGNIKDIGKALL